MRTCVVVALVLGMIAPAASAQLVQGLVVAEGDKRPLGGIRVALVDDSDAILKETTTDSADGAFFIDAPAGRRFRLAVFDRLDNSYVAPTFFDSSTAAVIERQLILPDLPPSYAQLPVFALTPLKPKPGQLPVPRYPESQRRQHHLGVVQYSVIVGEDGTVEPGSIYISASTNEEFARAVRNRPDEFHYPPASEAARPARVIVKRSITFNMEGENKLACKDVCVVSYTR